MQDDAHRRGKSIDEIKELILKTKLMMSVILSESKPSRIMHSILKL